MFQDFRRYITPKSHKKICRGCFRNNAVVMMTPSAWTTILFACWSQDKQDVSRMMEVVFVCFCFSFETLWNRGGKPFNVIGGSSMNMSDRFLACVFPYFKNMHISIWQMTMHLIPSLNFLIVAFPFWIRERRFEQHLEDFSLHPNGYFTFHDSQGILSEFSPRIPGKIIQIHEVHFSVKSKQ